jgi:hypothetical protein
VIGLVLFFSYAVSASEGLLALLLSGAEARGDVSVAEVSGLRPVPPHPAEAHAPNTGNTAARKMTRIRCISVFSTALKKLCQPFSMQDLTLQERPGNGFHRLL